MPCTCFLLRPILAEDNCKPEELARHIAEFSLAALGSPPRRRDANKPKRQS